MWLEALPVCSFFLVDVFAKSSGGDDILSDRGLFHYVVNLTAFGVLSLVLYSFYRTNQKTEDALQKSVAEYVQAKNEADAGSRAKSDFLALMGHELRTPLNGVIGTLDMMAHSELTDTQTAWLQTARNSGFHLAELINDILAYTDGLNNTQAYRDRIETRAFFNQSQKAFDEHIHAKGLAFVCSVSPSVPTTIVVDKRRLRQAVYQLLANAIKFTQKGSVRLDVSWRTAPGPELCIAVSDTGPGIREADQAHIFSPFSR